MKVMLIRKADKNTEEGTMPGQELLLAMGKYNEMLVNAGVMEDGTGLKPSKNGVRVNFDNGEPVVTNGPFTETHELVAGFTMLEVDSLDEAIEWAKQWPPEDAENGDLTLELRPVYGLEDFEQGEGLAKHQELEKKIQKQPSSITPHLQFNGKCNQALEFYAECLGAEITEIVRWGDIPMDQEFADEQKAMVAHANLSIGSLAVAGMDSLSGDKDVIPGRIILGFATPEQTRAAFDALAAGGKVNMEPEPTFWSSCFAVVTDKFGVEWSLNCEQAPDK